MKNQRWNNQSLHHICGQKDREKFNVTEDINKKIITQKQHDAFNIIMGTKQNPKEQLRLLLEERWAPVLSQQTKQELYDILRKPDREFYLKKIVKG